MRTRNLPGSKSALGEEQSQTFLQTSLLTKDIQGQNKGCMAQYPCDECISIFANMQDLTAHYKQEHPKLAAKFLKNTSC
ncbi:MAG TPA: hypothetical protein VJ742_05345 [Nitrososphaera sp.]|nr:hypothetical protein [Nitrososphaera sp.]